MFLTSPPWLEKFRDIRALEWLKTSFGRSTNPIFPKRENNSFFKVFKVFKNKLMDFQGFQGPLPRFQGFQGFQGVQGPADTLKTFSDLLCHDLSDLFQMNNVLDKQPFDQYLFRQQLLGNRSLLLILTYVV